MSFPGKPTGCVNVKETFALFNRDKVKARQACLEFIKERKQQDDTWHDLHSGLILGSMDFVRRVIDRYGDSDSKENIKKERFAGRPSLSVLFADINDRVQRNKLIVEASGKYGYTQAEIARQIGLHYASVSRIVNEIGDS